VFSNKVIIRRWLLSVLLFEVFLFLLTGCASSSSYNKIASCHGGDEQISNVKFQKYFDEVAEELCPNLCGGGPCADYSVIATDFVDIQTLAPGKIGVLMGELMRSSLNKVCGYNIIEVKFSHLFKLSDDGLITLTKNPNEILKAEYSTQSVKNSIVGTYSASSNTLYIFARIINNSDGKIIRMTSKEVKLSCD
jgi:hypothetical protein